MKTYEKLNAVSTALTIPFIFGAVFITVAEILLLLGNIVSGSSAELICVELSNTLNNMFPYILCYLFAVYAIGGRRWLNGLWALLCIMLFIASFKAINNKGSISYIFSIILVGVMYLLLKSAKRPTAIGISVAFSVLTGLLTGYLSDYFSDFSMYAAGLIADKGIFSSVLFGVVRTVSSLLDSNTISELFFYKSYGGTALISDDIITGIKDMLAFGYDGRLVSAYLSGQYYFLFVVSGISFSMLNDLKGAQKTALIAVTLCALLSGNTSLFLLFILLQCPFLFAPVLLLCALCYGCSYIIDLNIGYLNGGGIFELIMYADKWVYLIAGGVVFVATGYFIYRYCFEKYGITDTFNTYIPSRLNPLVKSLGGVNNIIRLKDGKVIVRNPKLVNNIALDCEICENLITVNSDKFNELKEYVGS